MSEMTEDELTYYGELTDFQKSVVDSLKIIGFEHKNFYKWKSPHWNDVNMRGIDSIPQLISKFPS